jgi:hypothetical protein
LRISHGSTDGFREAGLDDGEGQTPATRSTIFDKVVKRYEVVKIIALLRD